jgi:hypothetical protein
MESSDESLAQLSDEPATRKRHFWDFLFGGKSKNQISIQRQERFFLRLTERRRIIIESVQLKDDDARRSQNGTEKEPEEREEHDEESFSAQHV